ncbi:MAG: carboxypeptidase regulatory-like domain-containing protein [Brumimicrobium sp.]|nr:carboxypeptidase regulatory-like domain-containing protein [Brumimicrobium sp.]
MKTIRTILGIILLLSLFSCTKFGKNVTVKGRVLNPITGEGISGVQIILKRNTLGGAPGFQSGGSKIIKETTTDENGYYELNKLTLSGSVLMSAHIGDRHPIGWWKGGSYSSFQNLPIDLGKTTHADFHAVPYGKLKISLHNVNCQGVNDSLIYKRTYVSFKNISVFQPFILTGCYNNEGSFSKVPSGDYLIEWTAIKSGVSSYNNQVLTVHKEGQTSYNINY